MKHKLLYALASAMILVTGASHAQDKKTLAIVVKGLDNPFFEQINLGCQEWMKNNPDSEYECLYTGPASSADEAGEVQEIEAKEMLAVCLQHEVDHLDGKLFVDHLSLVKRGIILRKMAKARRAQAKDA